MALDLDPGIPRRKDEVREEEVVAL
jgi:hypothetical protein